MLMWIDDAAAMAPPWDETVCITIAASVTPRPAPPCSSGIVTPSQPSAAIALWNSNGKRASLSQFDQYSSLKRLHTAATPSRIARCSSENPHVDRLVCQNATLPAPLRLSMRRASSGVAISRDRSSRIRRILRPARHSSAPSCPCRYRAVLQADAHAAAEDGAHGDEPHLMPSGAQREDVVAAEQGSATRFMCIRFSGSVPMPPRIPKMHCTRNGGSNHLPVDEVRGIVEVTDIVAFELEAGAGCAELGDAALDLGKRVRQDEVPRHFEVGTLPGVLELWNLPTAGNSPKFSEPMFIEASSRLQRLCGGEPVVQAHAETTASRDVHRRRNSA